MPTSPLSVTTASMSASDDMIENENEMLRDRSVILLLYFCLKYLGCKKVWMVRIRIKTFKMKCCDSTFLPRNV